MLNVSVRCTIVGLCGEHDITSLFVCERLCVLTECDMRGYHLVTSCMVILARVWWRVYGYHYVHVVRVGTVRVCSAARLMCVRSLRWYNDR